MSTYKDDSDRFHEMLEQKERDLREAETWEKLGKALEARGVDIDSFSEMIKQIRKGFDKAGLSSDIQRDIVVKMLSFELDRPLTDEKVN
jgi:acyl-CoA reductase-like NAD-dependent aldehyde dehydrogenase